MEKLGSIIGLPVLETETGMQIGEIGEILVDVEGAILCGLIIRAGNWFASESVVAFGDLLSLGHDAVMVCNHHVIRQLDAVAIEKYNYYLRDLFNKEIVTDTGLRIGLLTDIIYDNVTGEMKWYQISDSLITDFLYGRMLMPLPQVQVVGHDKLIIPETMTKLIHDEAKITEIQ